MSHSIYILNIQIDRDLSLKPVSGLFFVFFSILVFWKNKGAQILMIFKYSKDEMNAGESDIERVDF